MPRPLQHPPTHPHAPQEIWNIFTFYSLHGNPLDPEHIRVRRAVSAKGALLEVVVGPQAFRSAIGRECDTRPAPRQHCAI